MKSLIIYYSKYNNNTEKVAKAIADKINADLINLNNPDRVDFDIGNYSIIGFGSGVYNESLSPTLFNLIEILNLKEKGLKSVLLLPIGYRDASNDWLVNLTKVRKSKEDFITEVN